MMDILHRIMSVSMQIFTVLVLMISLHRDAWQVNGQICNTPGWLDYGDSQYLIVNEGRTWSDARIHCQDNDGDLAVIISHEQTAFLVTYTLKASDGWNYWIGLQDSNDDGQYTWIDNTQPEYSNWSPSQPSRNHECVRMRSTYRIVDQGKWKTRSCSVEGVHICQRPKDSRCSWHRFSQSLYRFYGEAMSYDDARAHCMINGGDLAIIKSEEINNFLVGFISMSNSSTACYWLGLRDSNKDGSFTWVDDTAERRTESSWAPGEPNNANEYCACMNSFKDVTDERHGKWNNLQCWHKRPYICERPQVKSEAWIEHRNVQYYMPPFLASYFDAKEHCQQFGGSLAQLKTSEFYLNLTNSFNGVEFWFGLDSLGKEGVFQWADGTLLRNSRFTVWISGKPNNVQGYQFCVARLIDGWNNQFCNVLRRFVCEISKGCPPGKWNVPICDRLCDNCYNGGVCNPQTGTCSCSPGFTGKNCLTACGDQMFGSECELVCGPAVADDSSCTGNKFCLPGPNECMCIAGYAGAFCNATCRDGQFGSDCLQDCHCIDGMPCNVFTGRCEEGCESGWSGEGCQVPSVCPAGYFGANCTNHCNCPGNVGCDKVSGFCSTTEGQCELGFTSDSVDTPDSCNSHTGCYNLCSGTCHCRDGEDDCDSVTGSCSSGRCHPRWTGGICQIDRFQSAREKTNPGIAMFSCAISFDSPTNVEPDFVKATTGDFSMDNWKTAKDPPQNISSTLLNFTFNIQDFPDDSPIYCFIGDPFNNSSEFGYVRLPSAAFYDLPTLRSPPTLVASSHYWVVISWRPWNRSIDTGDGPITGYIVYVHTEDGNETHSATLLPDGTVDTRSSRGRREVASEDLDLLEFNITGLEEGTNYEIQIAVIREGPKGEGDRGPTFSVKTQELLTTQDMTGSAAIGPIAGGAVGGLLIILCLIVIIVLLLRRKGNRRDNVGKRSPPPQPTHNDYNSQEAPETDEELGRSCPSPSISSRPPGRPAVSPKRLTLAAASSDAMDREDAGVPSVSSPESGPKELQPIPLTDFPASVQKKSSRTLERPPITPKRLTLATVSPQAMDREDAGVPSVGSPESGPKERQPIPLSEFPAFVQKNRHSTFFQEEFNDLPEANIYPQTVAKKQINFEKNRYKNILPYDSSRVQLAILNDDPHSDYFNASFIPSFQHPRRYIASQGPNKASMDDFWRMVWQENVATIAMVTNLSEGNKIKCRQYWPETSATALLFGDITVELESVEDCSGGSKRSFVLRKGKAKTQKFLNQFHYTKWPDRDVPRNMSSLLDFISEVKKDHQLNNSPLLIHCSAGVGRTGVLITIDSVVSEAKRNKLVDIFGFVSKIRQNRPNMVQTKEQYKFVYEAVLEYLLSENTAIPVNYFTSRLARLQDIDRNSKGRRTGMSVQFENIKILCPDPPASMIRNGTTAENKPKSRYGNSLPSRVNRVMLRSVNTQSSDFINASFVTGNHGRFITTEMPMPNTVADFWVMILDYQPTAIIMLNDDNQRDKSCARYWFDNGMATFGYLSVLTLATTQREGFIQRTLQVSRGDKVRHVVEQYQFLDWPVDMIKQKKSARSVLKLIEEMREVYSTQNESPLVVHCLNGVGRTAVFCTVLECISQILDEDAVNVFQTVKMMRNDRMHFVQTEEDYALIHMLINGYIQTNDYEQLPCADEHTYGNLDCAARPVAVESVYELTEIEAGAKACPSQTQTEERNASEDGETQQVQAKTTDGETLYENFAYEL